MNTKYSFHSAVLNITIAFRICAICIGILPHIVIKLKLFKLMHCLVLRLLFQNVNAFLKYGYMNSYLFYRTVFSDRDWHTEILERNIDLNR